MINDKKQYLLLDLAQQSNSGDDIMQRTLFEFFMGQGDVISTSYYGSNEFLKFESEFSNYSELYSNKTNGGVFNTRYAAFIGASNRLKLKFSRTISRLYDVVFMLIILFCVYLKMPDGMLKLILGRDKFSAYSRYQRADIVVWNGRNFRGNEGALAEFVKIFELCANPLLCSFMHKPIYCVGASVWPLRGRLAKYILRITFNRCQKVWLREKSSLSNTQLLGSKLHTDNLSLLPDLSFYMLNKYVETILSNPQHREVKQNMVSLTLVGRKEISSDVAYFNYIDQVAEAINFLHKQGKIVQVVPQVTYSLEPFHTELELIVNKLSTSENLLILDKVSRLEQLVEIYNQSSLLIASRMHSAIFAASCGTPVIALSYDSGGKWSILRELNIQEDCILDISTLRPGHLVRALQAKLNITPRNNKNIIQLYADQISHELSSVTTIK